MSCYSDREKVIIRKDGEENWVRLPWVSLSLLSFFYSFSLSFFLTFLVFHLRGYHVINHRLNFMVIKPNNESTCKENEQERERESMKEREKK